MPGPILSRVVAVIGATAAVAFATALSATASAASTTTTTSPAAAAAGWLVQQFADADNQRVPSGDHIELSYNDGTKDVFFYDGGGTADATFALAAAKAGKTKIDTALGYLSKHLDEYAGYSDHQYGPYYGSIAKAAVAALVDGQNPQSFGGHKLITELQDDECKTGSTTCTPGSNDNIYSGVSTSFIVLAEARAAAADHRLSGPSADLVSYFLGEQCGNGGFVSNLPAAGGSACSPDVDATGYAVMALQALGGHDAEIAKAGDYLQSTRSASGAWVEQSGPNVDSTALATAALDIAGRSATASRNWLISQQVTDGPTVGTGSTRGALKYQGAYDANSSIKATSDGVLGLVPGTSLATLTAAGSTAGTAVLALDRPAAKHHTLRTGGRQTITGTGFSADETVHGTLHSKAVGVGSAKAGSTGTVTLSFTIPAGTPAGHHTLTLTGATSHLSSTVGFEVEPAAAPSSSPVSTSPSSNPSTTTTVTGPTSSAPALADTGRDGAQTRSELLLGAGLIMFGGLVTILGRQRRHGRHAR